MKKILVLLICVIQLSCAKKTNTNGIDLDLDYYPTKQGKFVIYQVDSTVYVDLPKDTVSYKFLLKEKIADSFTDNQGKNAIRIERYIKKFDPKVTYDKMTWTMRDVYLLNATSSAIQIQENNVRFTKLIFPIEKNANWNGNAGNTLGAQDYFYKYINNTESINSTNFENVVMVIQKEFHPLTLEQYYIEKYAKGYGLVYREITDLVSNSNLSGPVINRIESGLIYKQTFLSSGYE